MTYTQLRPAPVWVCGRTAAPQAEFSVGAVIDAPIHDGAEMPDTAHGWYPAIDSSVATRKGTWFAQPT